MYMRSILIVLFIVTSFVTAAQKNFRAAVVKINITPNTPKQLLGYAARLSNGIHDSIYHRIIVLDDGTTQFYLVSTEVCEFSPSEYDHVATQLNKKVWHQTSKFLVVGKPYTLSSGSGSAGTWRSIFGRPF